MSTNTPRLKSTAFLVGAGISVDSGVPLFQNFRDGFIRAILPDRTHVLRRKTYRSTDMVGLDVFPPEQLFYRLTRLGPEFKRSVIMTIVEYSTGREPNRNHFAIAKALEAGASIWTTNYDCLIEAALVALNLPFHVLSWPGDPVCGLSNCESLHIYKPHGSIDGSDPLTQKLIFGSEQVLLPPEPAWREAVSTSFSDKTVVLAGYRGHDIDLMPALATTMRESNSSALWMEFPGRITERQRFMLPKTTVVEGNPSTELQRFVSTSTGIYFSEIYPDVVTVPPQVRPVNFTRTHRAAGSLLSHIGETRHARLEYAKSVLLDSCDDRKRSIKSLTRSVALDYPLVNSLSVWWTRIQLRKCPDTSWAERWSDHLSIAERRGVRSRSEREITAGLNRSELDAWEDGSRISAISMLKLLGNFPLLQKFVDATDFSSMEPSLEGKAAYNTMWALRYQGRLAEWDRFWNLYEFRGSNFDPNWAAWIQLEDADLNTMLGNGVAALKRLESEAMKFARTVRHHDLFTIDADNCQARAEMLVGAPDVDYSPVFEGLYQFVNRSRTLRTPFRKASFSLTWAAAVPVNPTTKNLVKSLTTRSDRLSPTSMHVVLSEIIKHRHSIGPRQSLCELLTICRTTGFGYGEALLAIIFDLRESALRLSGAREILERRNPLTEPILAIP